MADPLIFGGIFEIGKRIIDKVFPDPEKKAQAEIQLLQMQQNGELEELKTRMSAILAEANSADPWTSRARPSFMYLFYTVIAMLVMITPTLGVWYPEQMNMFYLNVGSGFNAIPEPMWWTFTAGYLGYASARTYEKRLGVTK